MKTAPNVERYTTECHLCKREMPPAGYRCTEDICVCRACHHHMEKLPEAVAKSVERFLIGNVV